MGGVIGVGSWFNNWGRGGPGPEQRARDDQANLDADNQRKADAQYEEQKARAEQARIDILQQPKKITPDNYMANKSKRLAQLRLGMGSTMTGAGNPSLVAPTPLKNNLGA